jgi:hypothetical protein
MLIISLPFLCSKNGSKKCRRYMNVVTFFLQQKKVTKKCRRYMKKAKNQ